MARVFVRNVLGFPGCGVFVTAELLGQRRSVEFQGYRLEIAVPDHDVQFVPEGGAFGPVTTMSSGSIEPVFNPGTPPSAPPLDAPVTARMVQQVEVNIHFEDVAVDTPQDMGTLCTEATLLARKFVSGLVAHTRTQLHQDWLGSSADEATCIAPTTIFDADTRIEFPFRSQEWRSYSDIVGQQTDMTPELFDDIISGVVAGETPALSRVLIYDALFFGRVRRPPDLRLGVFSAAVAVEIHTKEVLESLCPTESRRLLDALFTNPRDYSVAMSAHLDKTAEAVCGRSLKSEDRALYKRVVNVFEIRNAIAHGKNPQPTDAEMVEAIKAAVDTFRWLSRLLESDKEPVDVDVD